MKKSFIFIIFLLISSLHAEDITENIYYSQITSIPNFYDPIKIHRVLIDPQSLSMELKVAKGERKKIPEFARLYAPLIAINAGHYLDIWDYPTYKPEWDFPSYLLKADNCWLSDPATFLSALGWSATTNKVTVGRLFLRSSLQISAGTFPVTRINKPRFEKDVIVYTPHIKQSTLTDDSGTEIIIQNDIITNIHNNKGNNLIPQNGYVLSLGRESGLNPSMFAIGESATITHSLEVDTDYNSSAQDWDNMDYIVSAVPLMIFNGTIITDFKTDLCFGEPYFYSRHPRTAFGVKEDGTFMIVVLEGRHNGYQGMTIPELAQYMKDEGCLHAVNLDGGGSSTLYIKDKGIVNHPVGVRPNFPLWKKFLARLWGVQRPVRDAIIIS